MGPALIVIIGCSFGGLTTAYELRRHLPGTGRADRVRLVKRPTSRLVP
jgi:glycine/D-amino acid oxidase-like deaminating enzyme